METWDVFISHASEDKEEIATPLYNKLKELGLLVWYDEKEIKYGQGITDKISFGLRNTAYIIMIFSPNFLKKGKKWTKAEESISAFLQTEHNKKIIPIYHNTTDKILNKINLFIRPLLACNTNNSIYDYSQQIAKDVLESNLINIFIEKKIKVEELQEIILEKIFHLDDPVKDKIRESNEILELMRWAYKFDSNFIPILKEIKNKKNIEHTNIENYINLLKKIHDKHGIDIEQHNSFTSSKIIGIVVDITLTDKSKNLYTVEIGVKYTDNTFKVKQCDDNVYITERDNAKLKEILSIQLKELIFEHNFAMETLIEFILPTTLLEIDFKDLPIITKRRQQKKCLIEYHNYIIRSKERIDYHLFDEDKNWIDNWKIYESNQKNKVKDYSKEIEITTNIGIPIAKKYPCIIQNFSLRNSIDDIIDFGISIVLSPLSNNNFSEFHKLVSDAFSKKELCYLYQEYNNFIRDNYEDKDRSDMLILWDDPTSIPNKENRTTLNKGVSK